MTRTLTALFAAALFAGFVTVRAEDKKDDEVKPPTGVWVKEANGLKVSFDFSKPDVVMVNAVAGENTMTLTSEYKIEKGGLIKATTTKIEEKGELPLKPKKGYKFEFNIKIDGKKATISDFKAKIVDFDASAGADSVVGEYTKVEQKK